MLYRSPLDESTTWHTASDDDWAAYAAQHPVPSRAAENVSGRPGGKAPAFSQLTRPAAPDEESEATCR